jgi:hypothetical protein
VAVEGRAEELRTAGVDPTIEAAGLRQRLRSRLSTARAARRTGRLATLPTFADAAALAVGVFVASSAARRLRVGAARGSEQDER